MYNLNSEFDIYQHKSTYTNYLEILIKEDGCIVYAVPSHQEKAIELAMEKLNKSRDEISEMCPEDMCFDFMNWLLSLTNSVALWNNYMMGKPNEIQLEKIQELIDTGLYRGFIREG